MKFLFILPHFHSYDNANLICMFPFIKELKKLNNKIDILCTDNKGDFSLLDNKNGCRIFSFYNEYNIVAKKFNTTWNNLNSKIKFLIKCKCFVKTIFKYKTNYYAVDAVSRKKIANILNSQYDIIISHSFPFASHSIANDLMKMNLAKKWFAFVWDPFVYNKTDPIKDIPNRKIVAENILKKATHIFMLEGIKQENILNNFNPKYHDTSSDIVLPIMQKQINQPVSKSDDIINLTFAGHFYSDIRSPEKMLDVLSKFPNDYIVNLIGSGCRKIIKEKSTQFNESVLIDYGAIEHEKCIEYLKESNILINLGNTITNQLPSKVFEYISMGKPIINFYFSENDLGLKYFKKYPLCFNFNLNSYTNKDINDLLLFCETNKNKTISFEEATKNLKEFRSENVISSIIDEIYKEN